MWELDKTEVCPFDRKAEVRWLQNGVQVLKGDLNVVFITAESAHQPGSGHASPPPLLYFSRSRHRVPRSYTYIIHSDRVNKMKSTPVTFKYILLSSYLLQSSNLIIFYSKLLSHGTWKLTVRVMWLAAYSLCRHKSFSLLVWLEVLLQWTAFM